MEAQAVRVRTEAGASRDVQVRSRRMETSWLPRFARFQSTQGGRSRNRRSKIHNNDLQGASQASHRLSRTPPRCTALDWLRRRPVDRTRHRVPCTISGEQMRDGGTPLQAALHGERLVSPHKTTAVMRTSQTAACTRGTSVRLPLHATQQHTGRHPCETWQPDKHQRTPRGKQICSLTTR